MDTHVSHTAEIASASRRPRITFGHLRADLSGALVAAVITLSESIPFGLLAFAALGPAYAGQGVIAGLYGAVIAGLVAAALGGALRMFSGPRASVAVIMATMLGGVAAAPDLAAHGGPAMAIALAMFGVFLAGLVEALFGIARLGQVIKFVPYPVIAGFMNGVALLLLLSQVPHLLGLPDGFKWADWQDLGAAVNPWGTLVGGATMLIIVAVPMLSPRLPSLLVGLLCGVAIHYGLQAGLGIPLGEDIGTIPPPIPSFAMIDLWQATWDPWILARMGEMLPAISILAVIGSIDSLMGAAALDSMAGARRHDSDRELLAQGLSNMASATVGGLPSSGAFGRSAAALKAGARTRAAGILSPLIVLMGALAAGPYLGHLPRTVLAAVLTVVALGMMDTWSRELLSRLRLADGFRRAIVANLLIVVVVAAVTVAVNLIAAVITGVLIAMVMFVTQMSKAIVRRSYDGTQRRSLKVRERSESEYLMSRGKEIVVVELDGPLFFGTADALLREVEILARPARAIILDFRRIGEIDATGVRLLLQIFRTLMSQAKMALMSHVTRDDANGRFLSAIAGDRIFTFCKAFPDTDAAMEWAEDWMLKEAGVGSAETEELPLDQFGLAAGLSAAEAEKLMRLARRREFEAGTTLFREGDDGDSLYLLTKGTVTIRLGRAGEGDIRLAKLIPGVMFGEMALLEGQRRSANAEADRPIVVYEVTKADFDDLLTSDPALAAKLATNMAREMAARLRVTNDQLRSIS